MGSQKNARKKAGGSGTGRRKAKKAGDADDVSETALSPPRPQPRPRVKLNVSKPKDSPTQPVAAAEEAAAAALVSIASAQPQQSGRRAEFEAAVHNVFRATVPHMEKEKFHGSNDGGGYTKSSDHDGESSSDSSSTSNDEDDQDLSKFIPVSSPAPDEQTKRKTFSIPFEVPFNGAARDLDGITSATSFDEFLDKLAHTMSTRKSLLSAIAYIPSYKPKNPKPTPKLLDSATAFERLISDVQNYIVTSEAKLRGKGVIKPFFIQIIDTSGGDPKGSAGGDKRKKKKDKEPEPAIIEKTEHQLYRQLEQKYDCSEHHKACIVLTDGNHYHLTAADLAKWAHMMSNHTATINTVPEELNILDAGARQNKAKKAFAQTQAANNNNEPPAWISHMMGIAMGGMMMRNNPQAAPPETPRRNQPVEGSSPSSGPSHQPSSGTKRAAALEAPNIRDWLSSLDADPVRGRHYTFFHQYCAVFENNGVLDLTDMEDLTATEIAQITGAATGIANRFVKYAKEDLAKLLKAANKRARN
ncbi:hypothetical protein C8J57DRAFT_1531981 [Mycena rebaudengoi]|nr:hypothetical protein C8J57DRAFT_1531981 [Mycena rebaudengoi]